MWGALLAKAAVENIYISSGKMHYFNPLIRICSRMVMNTVCNPSSLSIQLMNFSQKMLFTYKISQSVIRIDSSKGFNQNNGLRPKKVVQWKIFWRWLDIKTLDNSLHIQGIVIFFIYCKKCFLVSLSFP